MTERCRNSLPGSTSRANTGYLPPPQLLAMCEELDPELGATLWHFSSPAVATELDEELALF